jgi:hypothetical protein
MVMLGLAVEVVLGVAEEGDELGVVVAGATFTGVVVAGAVDFMGVDIAGVLVFAGTVVAGAEVFAVF